MNLEKLFKLQKELDEHILNRFPNLKDEDLLPKKILSLQVEIGELAQNWRGFKFWSKDQEPRTKKWIGMDYKDNEHGGIDHIHGTDKYKNPLLEEYVDCLHFIISIGLELELDNVESWFVSCNVEVFKERKIDTQFIYLMENVARLYQDEHEYDDLFYAFLGLGEMLGFADKQIYDAYMDKNKTNHERQNAGY